MSTKRAVAAEGRETGGPDYPLDEYADVTTPQQLKAVADDTRRIILDLLLDRAATTSQVAEALHKPKGTVGYHLKVLEAAGLIRVVRTRQVRAMTAKYYGRLARTFVVKGDYDRGDRFPLLTQAIREARRPVADDPLPMVTLRHMRVPQDRAVEFAKRVADLSEEFVTLPVGGDVVYGFVAAVYPTDRPGFRNEGER